MHYYQFNIGDYVASTQHLDPIEDIAYRRMLDLYYSKESPLPADAKQIARLIRMRDHLDSIEVVLDEFFTLTDEGFHNSGADAALEKTYAKSEAARKSALARWEKKKPENKDIKCETDANALQTQSECNATQYPIPNTQDTVITKPEDCKSYRLDYSLVMKLWNERLTKAPRITVMTDKRKRTIKRLFTQFDLNIEKWGNYLDYVNKSEKCDWMFKERDRGNGQNWQPKGFDYIASENCFLKVKEEY